MCSFISFFLLFLEYFPSQNILLKFNINFKIESEKNDTLFRVKIFLDNFNTARFLLCFFWIYIIVLHRKLSLLLSKKLE